jgi:hypothetical protein
MLLETCGYRPLWAKWGLQDLVWQELGKRPHWNEQVNESHLCGWGSAHDWLSPGLAGKWLQSEKDGA